MGNRKKHAGASEEHCSNQISVVTISVALFILVYKIIFTCIKIVAHPRLMPHCGIIWVHITWILGMKIIGY